MTLSAKLESALRMALHDPRAAFETLESLRKEVLDAGATASAASVSRTLVFAAKLAGDNEAQLRFAAEWHEQEGSESSARVLAAVKRAAPAWPEERSVNHEEELQERLVLLVEKVLVAGLDRNVALAELASIRSEALASGAVQVAARCLDEMILANMDIGELKLALAMARELVLEGPSARTFNMLGRAAAAASESGESHRAFELALEHAIREGDLVEETHARDGIAGVARTDTSNL